MPEKESNWRHDANMAIVSLMNKFDVGAMGEYSMIAKDE